MVDGWSGKVQGVTGSGPKARIAKIRSCSGMEARKFVGEMVGGAPID